jgi:dienelactone hydrolase
MQIRRFLAFVSLAVISGISEGGEKRYAFLISGDPQYVAQKVKEPEKLDIYSEQANSRFLSLVKSFPGTAIPEKFGGGTVSRKILGMLVTGDLIDSADKNGGFYPAMQRFEWQRFKEDYGLNGKDGGLPFPVYELHGNHDGPQGDTFIVDDIIERNKSRPQVVHISGNGLHYSWDWGPLHLVNLGMFVGAGEERRKNHHYAPRGSLDFLRDDLKKHVGDSGRPVILSFHLHPNGSDYDWPSEDLASLWEIVSSHNVIALLHGHTHGSPPSRLQWDGKKFAGTFPENTTVVDLFNPDDSGAAKTDRRDPGKGVGLRHGFLYAELIDREGKDNDEFVVRSVATKDNWESHGWERTWVKRVSIPKAANPGNAGPPKTVEETWALFDPRSEPLETEVISESIEEGIVLRYLRYLVGTFEEKKMRVAAFHAFPESGSNLPGIVQLHGGGQRARSEAVRYWAGQGYAAVAVNWGEYPVADSPDDPGTDWAGIAAGFELPKHHNGVTPGEATLHKEVHPWNSSWLLYGAAARRAITLLERDEQVDGARIGVSGHSMGGRLTVLTAIDPRVSAACPSVGGSGYLYEDIRGIPASGRHMREDLDYYKATLGASRYWPLIRCPLLFLGATNDFNSPMEKVLRAFRTLPQSNGALSFTPHMNHRFTADCYAARVRWFQAHLQGDFTFPGTPKSRLSLKTADGVPLFSVTPDPECEHELKEVAIYYGFERDPRVRFWRSAGVVRDGGKYMAQCPVMDPGEPLFVFANLTYDTGEELVLPRGYRKTSLLTVSSEQWRAAPGQLSKSGVRPTGERVRMIDDFSRGWDDWSRVSPDNSHHFSFKTHKLNDPAFFGPRGADLVFEIETTGPGNTLAVVMETDQWRGYTGRKTKSYVALVELEKAGSRTVRIAPGSFVSNDGLPLANYNYVTGLVITPGNKELPDKVEGQWQGKVPFLDNLRWVGGRFAPRPRTYLGQRQQGLDPDRGFKEAFEKAVKKSTELEELDRK